MRYLHAAHGLNERSTRAIRRTTLSRMAMGKRRRRPKQTSMWVATQDLPCTAAHPFYNRLNQILEKADFDGYVESLCQQFYADEVGRPGLPPGRYFRLLLIGYFEGFGRRARHRVACGGLFCATRVSRIGVVGGAAGPFDDLAHASSDRSRNAPGGLHTNDAPLRLLRSASRRCFSRWKDVRAVKRVVMGAIAHIGVRETVFTTGC